MPMQDVWKMIEEVRHNPGWREEGYACRDPQAFRSFQAKSGFRFEPWEFEDAFTNRLLRCQEAWEAQELWEVRAWYEAQMMPGDL